MLTPLTVLIVVTAASLGLWAAWFVLRDRAVILKQLWGAAVVEVLLLLQVVAAAVLLATGDGHADVGELWGYLITVLLILPFAAAWAFAERSRWSSVVLVLAAVTVIFLEYRLVQIWER